MLKSTLSTCKVFADPFSADGQLVKRFVEECEIAARRMGFRLSSAKPFEIPSPSLINYETKHKEVSFILVLIKIYGEKWQIKNSARFLNFKESGVCSRWLNYLFSIWLFATKKETCPKAFNLPQYFQIFS